MRLLEAKLLVTLIKPLVSCTSSGHCSLQKHLFASEILHNWVPEIMETLLCVTYFFVMYDCSRSAC